MGLHFRWEDRLHEKADFSRVIRDGRRLSDAGVVVWVGRREKSGSRPRMGLAVPGAFGDAPRRNRIKRLLRETFRLHQHELTDGVDLVFGARPMQGALTLGRIEPIVVNLWKKAGILSSR
jgi:ribonuclease P protein component